ncbi:hypothetical protein RRG08_029750 [Elysia crispata]|uniref:Uncharacterized protein n=1 Tax=Elysia crispata TaxID=231223 RepID=A0AAE1B5R6_9GAST|nr:hypothetical protein RRG08_029750 [Elysia crispata]
MKSLGFDKVFDLTNSNKQDEIIGHAQSCSSDGLRDPTGVERVLWPHFSTCAWPGSAGWAQWAAVTGPRKLAVLTWIGKLLWLWMANVVVCRLRSRSHYCLCASPSEPTSPSLPLLLCQGRERPLATRPSPRTPEINHNMRGTWPRLVRRCSVVVATEASVLFIAEPSTPSSSTVEVEDRLVRCGAAPCGLDSRLVLQASEA